MSRIVAAALERYQTIRANWPAPTEMRDAADEMARLLRAELDAEPARNPVDSVDTSEPEPVAQPAPAASGDDEAARVRYRDKFRRTMWPQLYGEAAAKLMLELAESENAALADLARVTEENAGLRALEMSHDGACVRLTEENAALRSEVEAIGLSYDRARLAAQQARAAAEAAVADTDEQTALLDDARSVLTNPGNYASSFDPVLKMARAYYSNRDRARADEEQ